MEVSFVGSVNPPKLYAKYWVFEISLGEDPFSHQTHKGS